MNNQQKLTSTFFISRWLKDGDVITPEAFKEAIREFVEAHQGSFEITHDGAWITMPISLNFTPVTIGFISTPEL